MIRTDRIFGVVVILVALAYIASAYNLPPGNIFDKLGVSDRLEQFAAACTPLARQAPWQE